ncbi:MAG: phosphomannomutase/phosphoglucomutase [Legionella sp.]
MRTIYQLEQVPSSVFRAYDIRGIVNSQFNENSFYSIGRAISYRLQSLNRSSIFLARDGRLTSDSLSNALKQGLLDSGINVLDLGTVATPVMYFATCTGSVDSGLMVTGSHNPAEYNGIKIVLAGTTLANTDIDILYQLNQRLVTVEGCGQVKAYDITEHYIERIINDIQLNRSLKVVIDCGNGIGGTIIPSVIQRLGCEVIPLYCDVDGRFPNHHPDPTIEANLADLKAAVAIHQADIGLAFDGDADRLGVVTDEGELIWPDRLMMLYARHLLKTNPGETIVCDVKCSNHLTAVIEQAGGRVVMCPTGHSIVKKVMKEERAILAGEMSGHLFFKDRWYGFDDALYSACRLLEILSHSEQSVSQQFNHTPNGINTPEIKIAIADEEKFGFMERFCASAKFANARLIDIDGLRVEFEQGWGLVRASNTTPCLVARFEASDYLALEQIKELFKNELLAVDQLLSIPF